MEPPKRDDLPAELRAFLYSCIDSIEQVEILMLLRRTERVWTSRAVTTELGLSETVTRAQLEVLTARGLLHAQTGGEISYRFSPKTTDLARYTGLLAEYYATDRGAVVGFIASRARRFRSFADAFKLRDGD